MQRTKRLERPEPQVAQTLDAAGTRGVVDAPLLRLGAALGVVGVVLQVVTDRLHPHHVDPNQSASVFREYAHSEHWTAVHLGQFLGTFLIVLALVALARALSRQSGFAGALAVLGGVTAVIVGAVFAIQMAVDGVALKAAIDSWVGAVTPGDQSSAFHVAESVRWTEKGLSGLFQTVNGATLLSLGLSIALGRYFPRWLGGVGIVAGVAFVAGGVSTAHTGFSAASGTFLLPATLLLAVFLLGVFTSMWRRGGTR
jgi:hypothetical protein